MDPTQKDGHPAHHHRRLRRFSRRTLIGLGVVAVVMIAARLALPYVMRRAINDRLDQIPDYTGHVEDVHVGLWRGAYSLKRVVISKRNGLVTEPFFQAERIDFSLAWRELIHRKFVGDIALEKPEITLVEGESSETTQVTADRRWQDAIKDIFPIDITWLKITDGQLRYINSTMKPKVDIRVAHVRALASGLRNRAEDEKNGLPATINLQGETIGGGGLKIGAQAEPLATEAHFLLKLELEQVSLPALNEFLRAYAGVDVSSGTFSGYLEVAARQGHFEGYFKPFFDHVDFSAPEGKSRNVKQEVWEWFVATFAAIFKNHPRDEVATKIPFSGETKNLDVHLWQTIKNLLHHAFVHPLQKKLDSKAPGGAGAAAGEAKDAAPKGDKPTEKPATEKPKTP